MEILYLNQQIGRGTDLQVQISRPVSMFKDQIRETFDIDISDDIPDVHPTQICSKRCIRKIYHAKADKSMLVKYRNEDKVDWKSHPRTNKESCFTCNQLYLHKKGPKKQCFPHLVNPLPYLLKDDNIFRNLIQEPIGSATTREPQHLATDNHKLRELYTCSICSLILDNPVQTPCDHYFCSTCLSHTFQSARAVELPCPRCPNVVKYGDVAAIQNSFMLNLISQHLKCPECLQTYALGKSHTCNLAQHETAAMELTNLALAHPSDTPVPEKVAEAVGVWLNVMLKGEKQVVELKSNPKAKKVRFTL